MIEKLSKKFAIQKSKMSKLILLKLSKSVIWVRNPNKMNDSRLRKL